MSAKTTEILQEILSLPTAEREELHDGLLALEQANPKTPDIRCLSPATAIQSNRHVVGGAVREPPLRRVQVEKFQSC